MLKTPKCNGKAKFIIKKLQFYITNPCTKSDIHNSLSKDKFNILMKSNKYNLIDFSIKKNQLNLIEFIFKQNNNLFKINLLEEFRKYTNKEILINSKEISRIKCNIIGKLEGLTLLDCIEQLKSPDYELEIMSEDVKYEIKLNNKYIIRKEKIIVYGIKERLNLMSSVNYKEFFIDITFKIIPKIFRPYKLLSIATIDFNNNKSLLIGFILFLYKDYKSFIKIFEYLNSNFNFNPLIIHSDYELGIDLALKESNFFKNEIIHIKCFFHFVKSLREKLIKSNINNKKYLKKEN